MNQKIRNSPTIILLFIAAFAGVIIGGGLFWEDYSSSYQGYMMLPTRKANDWIYILAALVPQVGQVVFGYSFYADEKKGYKLFIVVLLHFVDMFTDMWFKASGMSLGVWAIAFVETEALFTIGSEFLLATSFVIAIDVFPDMVKQTGKLFHRLMDAGDSVIGGGGDKGKGNNQPQQQHNQPQHHQQGRQEPGRQVSMPQQGNRSPQDMNRGGGGAQSAVQRYQQNQRNNRG